MGGAPILYNKSKAILYFWEQKVQITKKSVTPKNNALSHLDSGTASASQILHEKGNTNDYNSNSKNVKEKTHRREDDE